jgi:translation initiation factor 3 subunit F
MSTLVDLLTSAAAAPSSTLVQPTTDFEILSRSLNQVSEMLDRVLAYVRSVLAGEVKGVTMMLSVAASTPHCRIL